MERCTMPTASLRACKRPAFVRYTLAGRTLAQYCAQHDRAKTGHAAILRPAPWEYDSRALISDAPAAALLAGCVYCGLDEFRPQRAATDARRCAYCGR